MFPRLALPSLLASAFVLLGAFTLTFPSPAFSHPTTTIHVSHDGDEDDDDFEYAVILDDHQTTCSVSESHSWKEISRLQKQFDHPVVWFRNDHGDTYVIHDARWVKRAQEIIAPMSELGQKQGELGKVQGELGARQGRLGARQGELGMRQAAISMRLNALESRIDRRRDRGESVSDLERERASIQEEVRKLEREADSLSDEQERLGARQEELGQRQEVLGKEQERVSVKARADLKTLTEQAVEMGAAQSL
jgi:hypothetical protein